MIAKHARSGLPVLPEGYHWRVDAGAPGHPVTVAIQRGTVGPNGYTMRSMPIAVAVVPERWHWRIRLAASRLYRRNVRDGQIIERPQKPIVRWEDRYDLVQQYREEHG